MSVIRSADAAVHEMHGVRFTAYAAPSRGSSELCTWRLDIPAGSEGVPHRVSREEVLCVLAGTIRASVDGAAGDAGAGDVVVLPAGSVVAVGNPGPGPAAAWVTTSAGFGGVLPDGSWFTPPWTR